MVQHTQPMRRQIADELFGKLPTNCLSVFDHFVWLALKVLKKQTKEIPGEKDDTK